MLISQITSVYKRNPNFKGLIIVCNYVFMRYFRVRMTNLSLKILFSPIIIGCKFITDFLFKCEIFASTVIGESLIIHHVTELVLNNGAKLDKNVTLNHNTAIGNKTDLDGNVLGCPTVGDNLVIGPHSILFWPIKIGDNVIIGAGICSY